MVVSVSAVTAAGGRQLSELSDTGTIRYDTIRYYTIWNSLSNYDVVDISTINQFNERLDKFWMHQDVLYDYTADLTVIGDRSVHETNDV